jgi:nucleotide-binding universal stress UspA family protein
VGRVVVGTDGSKGAQAAVDFAAREARMRDASLEVVYVHPIVRVETLQGGLPAEMAYAPEYAQMVDADRNAYEEASEQARKLGEALLHDAVSRAGADDLDVESTLLYDRRPARRLVELVGSRDDVDLLVVGSRGRGELRGVLLGSVSQACVAHAGVPVTVVPLEGA